MLGFYTLTKARFIDNSGSKVTIKDPKHPLVDFRKAET